MRLVNKRRKECQKLKKAAKNHSRFHLVIKQQQQICKPIYKAQLLSILRVRGVSRKRKEMDQQSGGSTDEARGDDTIAKGKKTALAFVLADSSAWVKDKVAENKELHLYLSSNEDDELSISLPSLDELFENKTDEADTVAN
ncbi:hypothetical protein V8B55DRAFT_1410827 [Mucor lusitanicus]